ncbi:MAG: AAA family ATPase, partial [Bacteroidales bacterium]|nr:AAA family ATPase [Bacteroidales bacterium]
MIARQLKKEIDKYINRIPVVAIIGARQVGKTTLAKSLIPKNKETIFLDLEKSSDRLIIAETESFLNLNKGKTICIDEIQMMPSIFTELRNFIDNNKDTNFIVLGSSSPELLRNTSESLAGRIYYFELSPFLWKEIKHKTTLHNYMLVGGLPLSILATN